jgi:hypothetical protein
VPNQFDVTMSFFSTDPLPAFPFTGDGDKLTIHDGVLLGSLGNNGIADDGVHHGNIVINNGYILSGSVEAIKYDENGVNITNNIGGSIIGETSGIAVGGDSEKIVNHGSITGVDYFGLDMAVSSNHVVFTNDGSVFGYAAGIHEFSSNEGGHISNTGIGKIGSSHDGIYVNTGYDKTTSISNGLHATITGADNAIHSEFFGAIALTNLGKIIGDIECAASASNDRIVNKGIIQGDVALGAGNNVYDGRGGSVIGEISGGAGDDKFIAGSAVDVFVSHGGIDTFVFTSFHSSSLAKPDFIEDFTVGTDKINVHAIDADVTHAGHQHFVFIGTDSFAHYHSLHPGTVGMLRFDSAKHELLGNVDNHFGTVDFAVHLSAGVLSLEPNDFVL